MKTIHLAMLLPAGLAIACLLPAGAAEPDPRVKPGGQFHIEFPQLGASESSATTRMGVWIPSDYTSDRKFPLLVWFGGGAGGDNPGPARQIVGDEGFVCVGLPYQKGLVWKTPWSFYEPMLRELEKAVPNIHPRQRACAGYSSGGAAICHSMVAADSGFRDYFHAFMPGGAGWVMGDFSPLRGRPIFAFMGASDTRAGEFRKIEGAAKSARADITYLEYEGGHVMPNKHFPEMREWLIHKVVLRDLPELRKSMQAAVASREYGRAFRAADEIRSVTPRDSADHAEALATIERVKPHGEELARKVLAAPLAEQQRFVREWRGCDFAEPVAEKCAETAASQLSRILSQQPVSPAFLKKYITMWEGFPAADEAVDHYEKFAAEALGKVRDISPDSAKNQALRQFIATWEPAPSAAEARRLREEIARAEFETVTAIKAKGTMKAKLREFVRTYEGTEVEHEARRLLEER
jgi:hypothetical protein